MTPIAAPEPVRSSTLTRVAVGISIGVHVAAVLVSLGYAGAGLFESSEAEAVSVTVVTPQQVSALTPEPTSPSEPKPASDKLDLRPSPPDTQLQTQETQPANGKPAPAPTSREQPHTAAPPAKPEEPAFPAAQPDISMRYQVDLGLKAIAPPPPNSTPSGTSDFDAPATSKAEIDTTNIAAFRAHLKQCAALPAQIDPNEKVMIMLRARFTPDGRLAAPPILIEASASAKGPALMKAAIAALQSCQPYTTLPTDKYAEWRVLDLRFTPQDFTKG